MTIYVQFREATLRHQITELEHMHRGSSYHTLYVKGMVDALRWMVDGGDPPIALATNDCPSHRHVDVPVF